MLGSRAAGQRKLSAPDDIPVRGWNTPPSHQDFLLREKSIGEDDVPDPFKKRDKIPMDMTRDSSQENFPPSSTRAAATTKYYDTWTNYDDVPIPTVLKQIMPEKVPTLEVPEYAAERTSRADRASNRNRAPSAPANATARRPTNASSQTTGPPLASNRTTSLNRSSPRYLNSSPKRSKSVGRREIKRTKSRELRRANEYIFMDQASDAGTVVYISNPSKRVLQKVSTVQQNGERIPLHHTRRNETSGHAKRSRERDDQRVRFNPLEPVRPGSFLPRIERKGILADLEKPMEGNTTRSPSDDPVADSRKPKIKNDEKSNTGCQCIIL